MIDPDQVAAMIDVGFTAEMIAERLGCTVRHVRRIAQERRIPFWHNELLGTEDERRILWTTFREAGMSIPRIAFCVGRSRQAVQEYFAQPFLDNPEIPEATSYTIL